MKAMTHTLRNRFVACLILCLVTPHALASLSEDPDGYSFESAPGDFSLSEFDDTVAHSNQGGKKKQKTLFAFISSRRSLPSPIPKISSAAQGLLIEFEGPVMPSVGFSTEAPVLETRKDAFGEDTWSSEASSLVPAPGALVLLGLAAAARRRRRRI